VLLTPREVAAELRVDLSTVYRIDQPGYAGRGPVRRRPAYGAHPCSRARASLGLSEASPLTRGDLDVVSRSGIEDGGA
jgi:hypothetical protein